MKGIISDLECLISDLEDVHTDAVATARDEGYDEGHSDGYSSGYDDGFEAGEEAVLAK